MQIKLSMLAVVAAAMLGSGAALAATGHTGSARGMADNMYIGIQSGVNFLSHWDVAPSKKKAGFNVGGVLGYRYSPMLRFDLSADYTANRLEAPVGSVDVDVHQVHVLLNAYYDIQLATTSFVPYVGGGLGYAHLEMKTKGLPDVGHAGLGFQLAAGVNYALPSMPALDIGVGYRLLGTSVKDLETAGKTTTVLNNIIGASLTYNFSGL